MEVKVKKLNENAVIGQYAKPGDAGIDLVATSRIFDKYGNVTYGTGLAFEIPEGYVGLLFARSSISKYDLSLANAVGCIDSGFRGEVMFKFKPTLAFTEEVEEDEEDIDTESYDNVQIPGNVDHLVENTIYEIGDRIGQIIIMPYPQITLVESDTLSDTERGEGGFGSTGSK